MPAPSHDLVTGGAERLRDPPGRLDLGHVSLPVTERERMGGEPALAGDGQRRGGVDATGEQHDGPGVHGRHRQ
jgi:hypothetical protein